MTDIKMRRPRGMGRGADGHDTLPAPGDAIKRARDQAVAAIGALFDALGASIPSRAEPPLIDCERAGLGARAVKSLVDRGQLRAVKVRRRWLAAPADLRALLPEPTPLPAVIEPELGDEAAAERRADRILQDALRGTGLSLATKSADAAPKSATRARRVGR